MRIISCISLAAVIGLGAWFAWNNTSYITDMIDNHISSGNVITLEARYTAEQIMDTRRKELLTNPTHEFQNPSLKFFPYLLLDVKFGSADKKTREGVILWSMEDGEMVINTANWETSHGFADSMHAQANAGDFKIINALASSSKPMTKEELLKVLLVDEATLNAWLESSQEKHLVVSKENEYYLHFENPRMQVIPQTKFVQSLVTKAYSNTAKVSKNYSKSQIEKIAKAAFGNSFTIRHATEVFLPVINLEVRNPDGSIFSSYWNALTGQRISPRYHSVD